MCVCVCLGMHLAAAQGDWTVQSSGGTKWQDVDLKEKEWTEFCEKGNESVGIYNFESKIELRKG